MNKLIDRILYIYKQICLTIFSLNTMAQSCSVAIQLVPAAKHLATMLCQDAWIHPIAAPFHIVLFEMTILFFIVRLIGNTTVQRSGDRWYRPFCKCPPLRPLANAPLPFSYLPSVVSRDPLLEELYSFAQLTYWQERLI